MYIRLKVVRGRRCAHLIEGERQGRRIRQRVVRYLGPVSGLAFGRGLFVPGASPSEVEKVRAQARQIPIHSTS